LFQRYLYDSLSAGERRLLHSEIGRALESFFEGQTGEIANRLAHHFLEAGERNKAIEYNHQAARRAQALYAYEEAIQHLETALDLLESDERVEVQLGLLEELADVHGALMKDTQAIFYYQAALEMWSSLAGADKLNTLRLHRKVLETGFNLRWNVEFEALEALSAIVAASRAYLEASLPLARSEQPQLEWVRVFIALANFSKTGIRSPSVLDTTEGYARAAVDLAEQLDAPEEPSDALETLGNIYHVRGLLQEQLELRRRQLVLSQDPRFGDLRRRSNILASLSDALMDVGEYAQVMPYLLEAESLAIQIGAVAGQIWTLALQSLCLFRLDRWEELFKLDEKRQELDQRYSRDQLGGGNCLAISVSAAARALQGDLDQARVMRERSYSSMVYGAGGSPENWGRSQHY